MGLFKKIVRAAGKPLVDVAIATKKINQKVLLPGIKFGARLDPGARLMQRTGWFKEGSKSVTPHEWAWRASTIRGPGSKTGQVVLPIAGAAVAGFFTGGNPAAMGAGAGFGRAVAGTNAGKSRKQLEYEAGMTGLSTAAVGGAAQGAGAMGAGTTGRAAAGMATSTAIQKAQGVPNRQIAYNVGTGLAGMAGGYAGAYGGRLMTGSNLGASVGGTLGSGAASGAARYAAIQAAMKQTAQQQFAQPGAYPPSALPATMQSSSAPPAGAFRYQMDPRVRGLYQHLR